MRYNYDGIGASVLEIEKEMDAEHRATYTCIHVRERDCRNERQTACMCVCCVWAQMCTLCVCVDECDCVANANKGLKPKTNKQTRILAKKNETKETKNIFMFKPKKTICKQTKNGQKAFHKQTPLFRKRGRRCNLYWIELYNSNCNSCYVHFFLLFVYY